ncbi:MAG TPA: hypothetical protein VJ765_07340 [Chitinophagaceae bacterium]|nr:hypothetical protein [Chitinophagaceae bacterium]
MTKILSIKILILISCFSFSQEAMKIQSGGSVTIQTGAELILQGGLTLDNGSSLLNNGTISLKNNGVANISNWTDNSILGGLTGTGIVIFNSTHSQQFTGPTSFYTVYINTNDLTINNDLNISSLLRLIKGKINTANYVVVLFNTTPSSLENDITNTNYVNSWVNGNLRRSIAINTGSYDFPVGNSERSNLLKFLNNNLTGPTSLTSSFIPKAGTDAGLNVIENGYVYTAVNNGGVWKLVPNSTVTGGNYGLHLYFNEFTGLTDNQFGILRRPEPSSNAADWMVPTGSQLEPIGGLGRKVSDGFARRFNIPDFSQFGIGEFSNEFVTACTYTHGFYGNAKGLACYNSSGVIMTSSQLMLGAFGGTTSKVFGNIANKRFFTLYSADITNGNIYKMLPGGGTPKSIDADNILPFDGAYYGDQTTWPLVPLKPNNPQKGKILNSLLVQTISLWFNLSNSSSLGNISLAYDTLVTKATVSCSATTPIGEETKFGIPHNIVTYLNGANGYPATVLGLFELANDVLGGVNTNVDPALIYRAIDAINTAFDKCRVLIRTIPYNDQQLTRNVEFLVSRPPSPVAETIQTKILKVTAYPNPYKNHFQLVVTSPVTGNARIEFFTSTGQKIYEMYRAVAGNSETVIPYTGPLRFATIVYKVSVGKYTTAGIVLKPN